MLPQLGPHFVARTLLLLLDALQDAQLHLGLDLFQPVHFVVQVGEELLSVSVFVCAALERLPDGLLVQRDLPSQRDPQIRQVQPVEVASLHFLVVLLVDQLCQLIAILGEAEPRLDLLVLLLNEEGVDLELPVVGEEAAPLGLTRLLVRNQTQAEVFVLPVVRQGDDPLGLVLLHFVDGVALFEKLNLPDHVLLVVVNAHEGPLHPFLVVGVLEPLANVSSPQADLLELGQLHGLHLAQELGVLG